MKRNKRNKLIAGVLSLCLAGASVLPVHAAPEVQYDVNQDYSFDILDVISLTKYLHMKGALKNAAAGDVNGDGEVDIFDLALMMRALVGLDVTPDEPAAQGSKNLAEKVKANAVETVEISEDVLNGQTQFALDLLKSTASAGENVLVSPYSVTQALGMTANGADGNTLTEMESVLGGSMVALNPAIFTLRQVPSYNLAMDWEFSPAVLNTANSIWVRDGYPVSEAFLQTNADYYGADAFSTPMDETTQNDVNSWVDERTDHMILTLLDEPPTAASLILVNAVCFDGLWVDPFDEEYAVREAAFTAADGTEQTVQMMYSNDGMYLSDDHAEGFLRYYQGGKYAFAAFLPEEGMTPEEYLDTLSAEGLRETLQQNNYDVGLTLGLPEFSYDFDAELSAPLSGMGMPSAFLPGAANFSRMTDSENELYIDSVIHKTHIEVTPGGTRAAAATAVLVNEGAPAFSEFRDVILDRPFVYMIVDTEHWLPVFIGTVNSVE